jgi:hypothetical protein
MITRDTVWATAGIAAIAMALGCGTKGAPAENASDAGSDDANPDVVGEDDATLPHTDASHPDADGGSQALWYDFSGTSALATPGVGVDRSGNVFYSGNFAGSIDFGDGGSEDAGSSTHTFLAKYGPAGNYLWGAQYGDNAGEQPFGLAVDSAGNVYITGSNYGVLSFGGNCMPITATPGMNASDIFIAKLDPTGKCLWANDYGDPTNQSGNSVAVDAQGNVVFTGNIEGSTTFGSTTLTSAGMDDIFLAKLDPNGNTLWAQSYGDGSEQFGISVAFDASGDIALTADFQSTVNVGLGTLTSAGMYDVLLAKFDPTGKPLFGNRYGDTENQTGDSVAIDATGNVVLSGGFQGTIDFGMGTLMSTDMGAIFLAKFDPTGKTLWASGFGDADPLQNPNAVALDSTGAPVLVGQFTNMIDFGNGTLMSKAGSGNFNMFVAKFDPGGTVAWADRYGGPGNQAAQAVAVNASGDIIVGGSFEGMLGFGNGMGMMSMGMSEELFLVELSPGSTPGMTSMRASR